jgi:hypothetical protein
MKTVALFILVSLISLGAAHCAEVMPLGVTGRTIGGGSLNAYTPGVAGGVGLNNIGLLVRMCGRVTFKDEVNKFFYIDDGYGRSDGSGHLGVRVSYDNLAVSESFSPPSEENAFVAVTGISSTVVINNLVHPNLLPRRSVDMSVY